MKHLVDNNFNTNKLQNVPTPIDLSDAVNKAYVDSKTLVFNVKEYGAIGDGVTDDRLAIQAANDAAEANGGGVVYYPKGVYLLNSSGSGSVCVRTDGSGVWHVGEGRGVSILKLGNAVNSHMLGFYGTTGGGVRGLEFDGNMANNTVSAHAIRGASLTGVQFTDFYIHDVQGYGIGLQDDGTFKDIIISNGVIERVGSDAIDTKNRNDDNSGCKIDNLSIRDFALNTSLNNQVGIDLRGVWTVSNVDIRSFTGTGATAVRFREGELDDVSGYGGFYSSISNFYIESNDTTSGTKGISVDCRQVSISSGAIRTCGIGIMVNQREALIGQVQIDGCVTGMSFNPSSLPTGAERSIATGCVVRGCSGDGVYVNVSYVQLIGILARSNNRGITIAGGAAETIITGEVSANSATDFSDLGTRTQIVTLTNADEWRNWNANVQGFSGTPSVTSKYKLIGKTVHVMFEATGESNSTGLTFTLPLPASQTIQQVSCRVRNGGSTQATPGMIGLATGSTSATFFPNGSAGAWSASGIKSVFRHVFTYETT